MNALDKIKRSWWVIFSPIILLNGLGFIFIGTIHDNKNWILEGVIYEIPWVFGIIFSDFDGIIDVYVAISMILLLVSIVRSVWVAIKLLDVYENEERYAIQSTALNNSNQDSSEFPTTVACVSCLVLIFIAYAILAFI
ncbi:hypothetical protein [Methanobrevibacter sp.]|uniref:hypothetical protein n=1 Tax=Methanobrevibacter sp. TaxID=66852 RepID=UPI00388F4343